MHVDPTPTDPVGIDLSLDRVLDFDSKPIFTEKTSKVVEWLRQKTDEDRDIYAVFSGKYVKIMSVSEYLSVADLPDTKSGEVPLPERKWNQ